MAGDEIDESFEALRSDGWTLRAAALQLSHEMREQADATPKSLLPVVIAKSAAPIAEKTFDEAGTAAEQMSQLKELPEQLESWLKQLHDLDEAHHVLWSEACALQTSLSTLLSPSHSVKCGDSDWPPPLGAREMREFRRLQTLKAECQSISDEKVLLSTACQDMLETQLKTLNSQIGVYQRLCAPSVDMSPAEYRLALPRCFTSSVSGEDDQPLSASPTTPTLSDASEPESLSEDDDESEAMARVAGSTSGTGGVAPDTSDRYRYKNSPQPTDLPSVDGDGIPPKGSVSESPPTKRRRVDPLKETYDAP